MRKSVITILSCLSIGFAAAQERPQPPKPEPHAWLGIATDDVPRVLSQHLDLPDGFGVIIAHIPEGAPAEEAGLKPGDVLTKLGDQILTTPQHLAILVRSKDIGDTVELTYLRKAEEKVTEVKLGEHTPKMHPEMARAMESHPRRGTPEEWRRWAEKMRQNHEERFRKPHPQQPQQWDKPTGRGQKPQDEKKPEMKSESTAKINNDKGAVTIAVKNGKGEIEIADADGNSLYDGPYDPAKGARGLPAEAREHLEKMEVDQLELFAPKKR